MKSHSCQAVVVVLCVCVLCELGCNLSQNAVWCRNGAKNELYGLFGSQSCGVRLKGPQLAILLTTTKKPIFFQLGGDSLGGGVSQSTPARLLLTRGGGRLPIPVDPGGLCWWENIPNEWCEALEYMHFRHHEPPPPPQGTGSQPH